MNGFVCHRQAFRTVVVAALLLACCLGSVGCQPASKAKTAVILHVEWEKVKEVRQANLHPQRSRLEITAVLESGEEVTDSLPISWGQSDHLKEGAKLMIETKDKPYFEALVTIIPE